MICELCGKENVCTLHHLIPKKNHTNKWFKKNFTRKEMDEGIMVCKYPYIHSVESAKNLGREYNTLEKLKGHKLISKYVKFIQNKT